MKKSKAFLILLALVLLLTSCGDPETESTTGQELTSEAVTLVQSDISETVTDTDIGTAVAQQDEKKPNNSAPVTRTENIPPEQNNVSPPVNIPQNAEVEQPKNPDTINVTLSVDCKNAINYGILNVGTFSEILSPDGIILPETSIETERGTSVVKALKSVLKANNITYKITSSGYVKTINGLSEFDCGNTSGWLYLVNGELPSVSAKSYILKDGDKVEFRYTCVKGDV